MDKIKHVYIRNFEKIRYFLAYLGTLFNLLKFIFSFIYGFFSDFIYYSFLIDHFKLIKNIKNDTKLITSKQNKIFGKNVNIVKSEIIKTQKISENFYPRNRSFIPIIPSNVTNLNILNYSNVNNSNINISNNFLNENIINNKIQMNYNLKNNINKNNNIQKPLNVNTEKNDIILNNFDNKIIYNKKSATFTKFQKIRFKFIDLLKNKIFCKHSNNSFYYFKAVNYLKKKLSIEELIKKIYDIDKLKFMLLDYDTLNIFELIQTPNLLFVENAKNKEKNYSKSQSEDISLKFNGKTNKIFHLWNKFEFYTQFEKEQKESYLKLFENENRNNKNLSDLFNIDNYFCSD